MFSYLLILATFYLLLNTYLWQGFNEIYDFSSSDFPFKNLQIFQFWIQLYIEQILWYYVYHLSYTHETVTSLHR